jgi:basic membrane protein A
MRKRLLLILSILLSFTLLAAACGDDDDTTTEDPADTPVDDAPVDDAPVDDAPVDDTPVDDTPVDDGSVGLVFDIGGEGDQSFNDSAAAGLARAEAEFGLTTTKLSPNDDGSNRAELLQLLADSNDLVIAVGFLFADDATEVSGANADTNFGVIDDAMLDFDNGGVPRSDNAAGLTFAEEQGSFLVGAAAASVSETGTIGFIGGVCCFGLIEKFQAGYIAGAKAVNPDIEIISDYITEFPNFDGFNDPAAGRETALAIYEAGADVIYHAAGGTGAGVFASASTPISTTPWMPTCRSTSSPRC